MPKRVRAAGGVLSLAFCLVASGCSAPEEAGADPETETELASPTVSFDGSQFSTDAEKLAHGERIARILGCSGCHLPDYQGYNFGELIPLVEGLWATNISLTLPSFSDAELERLLREGVHPDREMYLMPSKLSQFLSDRDMDALIAHLRTVAPVGEPTPVPPPGFEEAVTSRLPEDYWRIQELGEPRYYHNSAEEVSYFAQNAPPEYGADTRLGRLVTLTVCTSCHGAALDGLGESAGPVDGARDYGDAELGRLLRSGIDRNGEPIELEWVENHVPPALTDSEVEAAVAYLRKFLAAEAN